MSWSEDGGSSKAQSEGARGCVGFLARQSDDSGDPFSFCEDKNRNARVPSEVAANDATNSGFESAFLQSLTFTAASVALAARATNI